MAVASLMLAAACAGGDSTNPGGGDVHRIAVAVTNLMGTGAVVQLNGAHDQTPAPTNTFVYFTDVAKGTNYTITVKSQPSSPWQTCVIGNGTGTMGSQDVTGPTMDCATNAYKLRGTVSGLTGAGLTVANGDGAPVAIPAGATTFEIAGALSMSNYALKVATQPAGQTCALNNGSGMVTNADVSNVTLTCGAVGFTVGGGASGVGSAGLTMSLNGGPNLPVAAAAAAFTFPNVLKANDLYSVVITAMPPGSSTDFRQSCALARARGKVGSSSVTDVFVSCRANAGLTGYDGVYAINFTPTQRSFLMLLADGTYSFAVRSDDPTCPQAGNGAEYGVYSRGPTGNFSVRSAMTDRNGGCGVWDSQASPAVGITGTLTRNNDVLTLVTSDGTFVLNAVASVATSLVGAFTRADGVDGSFIVFEPDGTYLYQEAQDAGTLSITAGWERGCYTVTGSTFTTSLAATCKPSGIAATDLNNRGGFSAYNGAAIPFSIVSATTVMIDGQLYRRVLPGG